MEHGRSGTFYNKKIPICVCGAVGVRNEQYDAYFCHVSGEWLESACQDINCIYCPKRPAKLEPVMQAKDFIKPVTSLMLDPKIKNNPSNDDLILEARGLLADRYNWRGRQMDVADAFNLTSDFIEKKSATVILKEWDDYNHMRQVMSKMEYQEKHKFEGFDRNKMRSLSKTWS